ncbi:MAG: hypothetical protein NZM37_04020 [Sandaracinaceae bacterium]|nr:hypothetical protein [Sandaracinaceae bacterium]
MVDGESKSKTNTKIPWYLPVIVVLGAAPALGALFVFGFIVRYSLAHDEKRCPFELLERREVAQGVWLREEKRRCLEDVEEHRWVVEREGKNRVELGRYPLLLANAAHGFRWEARIDGGNVVVEIDNQGKGKITLKEKHEPNLHKKQPYFQEKR